jgi:hypothetical protein
MRCDQYFARARQRTGGFHLSCAAWAADEGRLDFLLFRHRPLGIDRAIDRVVPVRLAGKRAQVALIGIVQNDLIPGNNRQALPPCCRDQNAVGGITMKPPRQE